MGGAVNEALSERVDASDGGAYWAAATAEVLMSLGVNAEGLTSEEAAARLASTGPNRLTTHRTGAWRELRRQFTEPIMLVLIGATMLSLLLGDTVDALIILAIIGLSALLGFWQEHGASVTVERLLAQVQM